MFRTWPLSRVDPYDVRVQEAPGTPVSCSAVVRLECEPLLLSFPDEEENHGFRLVEYKKPTYDQSSDDSDFDDYDDRVGQCNSFTSHFA